MPRGHAMMALREGDLILGLDGLAVVTFRDIERLTQRHATAAYGSSGQTRLPGKGATGAGNPTLAPGPSQSPVLAPLPTVHHALPSLLHGGVDSDVPMWASGPHGAIAAVVEAYRGPAGEDDAAVPRGSGGAGGAGEGSAPTSAASADGPAHLDGDAVDGMLPAAAAAAGTTAAAVDVIVLRDGAERCVPVVPSVLTGVGTQRIIQWCGMLLQEAHDAVEARGFIPSATGSPPYVSRWSYGSPAHKGEKGEGGCGGRVMQYTGIACAGGLRATNWIVEVNGVPVHTMDVFLDVVRSVGHGQDVRLRCVDLMNRKRVFTLRTDHHFWPPLLLQREVPTADVRARVAAGSKPCDLGKEWKLMRLLAPAAGGVAASSSSSSSSSSSGGSGSRASAAPASIGRRCD